jgi:16S rRNA (uracil1498-N3)-methyltransferase
MARYDFTTRRLYVDAPLSPGVIFEVSREQAHYLVNVLRMPPGGELLAFNGKDGEWRCAVSINGRKSVSLSAIELTRAQTPSADLHYLFAPLKHARLDYMVQKAVEMGASLLQPVLTRHTHVDRLNVERMKANIIEAAEQCGILAMPSAAEPVRLDRLIAAWPDDRLLVFCDEDADADLVATLREIKSQRSAGLPLAVLIGPEGGFDAAERRDLLSCPNSVRVSLGPRILRADTAAVAALALVQAILGDWQQGEEFS